MARRKTEETPEPTTAWFVNVSPLGALDVPALGRVIDAGEAFEVRAEVAALLDGQHENFQRLAEPPVTEEDTDDDAA